MDVSLISLEETTEETIAAVARIVDGGLKFKPSKKMLKNINILRLNTYIINRYIMIWEEFLWLNIDGENKSQ